MIPGWSLPSTGHSWFFLDLCFTTNSLYSGGLVFSLSPPFLLYLFFLYNWVLSCFFWRENCGFKVLFLLTFFFCSFQWMGRLSGRCVWLFTFGLGGLNRANGWKRQKLCDFSSFFLGAIDFLGLSWGMNSGLLVFFHRDSITHSFAFIKCFDLTF